MKTISNKEYEAYDKYKSDLIHGRILTPGGLKMICEANEYDPERIGTYFLGMLAKLPHGGYQNDTRIFLSDGCQKLNTEGDTKNTRRKYKRTKSDSPLKCPYCYHQFRMTRERYYVASHYRDENGYAVTTCRYCGKRFKFINATPQYFKEHGLEPTVRMD